MLDSFTDGNATKRSPRGRRTDTVNGQKALPPRSTSAGQDGRQAVKAVPWQRPFLLDLFTGAMIVLFLWVPLPAQELPAQELHTVVTKTFTVLTEPARVFLKTD